MTVKMKFSSNLMGRKRKWNRICKHLGPAVIKPGLAIHFVKLVEVKTWAIL